MNTKLILALAAIATVSAALIGVAAAQYANNTSPFATTNRGVEPPCVTVDISQTPEWCVNATTGEPFWLQNGIQNANAQIGDCNQNGYAYGYGYGCDEGYENQYQHQQRVGGMYERNIGGLGGCR